MKTVVVGASSGLGRSVALGLAQRGAQVALLARRRDRLEQAAKEAGGDAAAIVCDVTDEGSVTSAIAEAADALGGIDAVLYATGVGPFHPIAETDLATWRWAFDTNVIGASLVTAAALPHLAESGGTAAYLSSTSASFSQPWPGIGAYIVSKAALEKLVDVWRSEHPTIGFTRITVGECAGGEGDSLTEFANDWDQDVAAQMVPLWMNRNYMSGHLLDVDELVRVVDHVLRCGATASIPIVAVVPRPPTTSHGGGQ